MSRWSSGIPKSTVQHQDDSEVVVERWNSAPAAEVIDVQAEEGRMPVEQSSDQYMNKLVDKVRQGLKPDFDAVNAGITGLTKDVAGLNTDVAGLTTNLEEQAKVSASRFEHLDQRFNTFGESLDAIKKHLGI